MLKKISIAIAGAILMSFGLGSSVKAADFEFEVLASGLDSPRGMTFGPDGALYVTEAGRGGAGPCIPAPAGSVSSGPCYGQTGAITRIQNGRSKRVVTGLPSIASPEGVLAYGPQDIAFDSTGNPYVIIGFAGDQNLRDNVVGNSEFGQLIAINKFNRGNKGASWTRLADLTGYEAANNPDGEDLTSNPYAFLIRNGKAFIVDAGANDLLKVGLDGSEVALKAVFNTRLITDAASGANIPVQSVPSSIAIGPDHALYVGEFTGFPYPAGEARIYRINSNNQSEVYLDGFTNIVDLAFDSEGNLYVLQFSADQITDVNRIIGALIRVAPDGTRTTIADGLLTPTALALSSDGAIYIANKGYTFGEGEILRIVPKDDSTSVPE